MTSNYNSEKEHSIEWPSIFRNYSLQDDKNLLKAVQIWEMAADEKYIDIKGYACSMLACSASPKDCAADECKNIDILLSSGECKLFIGYNDFDLDQIPFAYKAMLTGRWAWFISIDETKNYLDSIDTDDFVIDVADKYFSRKWIVASQVQALIWYKEFLKDVIRNGFLFTKEKIKKPKGNLIKKRLLFILSMCKQRNYDPLEIPYGGKKILKDLCLENKLLFPNDSAFKRAWEDGNKCGKLSVLNKEKYLKNQ